MLVLKVAGEDIEWNINIKKKGFVWMGHGRFV